MKEIESLRGLASRIHENRLRGLYVSSITNDFVMPTEAISAESLSGLMRLVKSRLAIEPHLDPDAQPSPENIAVLRWLENATEDNEKRHFIFSSASFDKLEQFGDLLEWAKWLKGDVERIERESAEKLSSELQRHEPGETEALDEKWQVKVRLFSHSHSLRPKIFNEWNSRVTWIKLHLVDKKAGEFVAEFRFPKAIPLQGLWYFSFGYANTLLTALNIGSAGFFWWYLPKYTGDFPQLATDLETKMTIGMRRVPELKIEWPREALDTHLLNRVIFCFIMLPQSDQREKHLPFTHYLTGLGFMAKTDVFLQFEIQAYGAFLAALETGTEVYQLRNVDEKFNDSLGRVLEAFIPDEGFRNKHIGLAKAYSARSLVPGNITLSEVAEIKLICDAFFFDVFNRLAAERGMAAEPAEHGNSEPDAEASRPDGTI